MEAEVQDFQPVVMTVTTMTDPLGVVLQVHWVLDLAEVLAPELRVLVVLVSQEVLEALMALVLLVLAAAEPRPVPVWDWGLVEALVLELEQA